MNLIEKIKSKRREKKAKLEKEKESADSNDNRDTWGGQLDFFLSTLGYAGKHLCLNKILFKKYN